MFFESGIADSVLPTFFVAGAPKAGTTSTYNYLQQHPEIVMSRPKEPHFFSWADEGWPKWAVKDREAYETLFDAASPEQERGDASTWTLYSKGAPRRIAAEIPDARFIILLRNPAERAYSNWSFNFGRGFDSIGSFEAALAAEPERFANRSPWHHYYVRAGLYYPLVNRYLSLFDRRQLHFVLFDDLKQDSAAVARAAYEFLGVDPSFKVETGSAHNATYFPRVRRLHDLSWGSHPLKTCLKRMLPSKLTAKLGRQVKAFNKVPPPKISPATRHRLNRVFEEDISKLSGLIDRDLHALWLS